MMIDASHEILSNFLGDRARAMPATAQLSRQLVVSRIGSGPHFFGPLLFDLLCPGELQLLPGQFVELLLVWPAGICLLPPFIGLGPDGIVPSELA